MTYYIEGIEEEEMALTNLHWRAKLNLYHVEHHKIEYVGLIR